jgi:effector-binding domain-containing protein
MATWWSDAFGELHRVLAASSAVRSGPDGALYPNEYFEEELGEVVAFIPVAGIPTPSGRPRLIEIPGAELAIAEHNGAISELDQTYGALGTFVTEREIGVQGPIREHYVVSSDEASGEPVHHTEVCWPVFRTKVLILRVRGSRAGAVQGLHVVQALPESAADHRATTDAAWQHS